MPNVIRIVVEGDDRSGPAVRDAERHVDRLDQTLDDASRSADRLGEEGRRAAEEITQSMERAAAATEDVGESGESAGGALNVLRDRAGGALDGLMGRAGMAGEALSALGPYGKAAAAAIGVAIGGAALAVKLFAEGIEAANARAADLAQSKAVLGVSGADAARFGRIAGQVYMDNWGESIKSAGEAVRNAALFIMPTPAVMDAKIAPTLAVVAERVQALADTMDEDTKRVSVAIQHMLLTGMAKSATEAFDLIHAGISAGVDSADDLLDTFIEYSVQFKQLGLDGQTAMGLLSQGLKAGARDADTVADGLKEIAIRAQDGSKSTQDAFKGIGLDAAKLGAMFAAGGPSAAQALDMVLVKLKAIKDPAVQSALAVQLFGTKAEDMQKALFNLDMKTAVEGLGQIAGAADKAAATLSATPMAAIEAYKRKWEMFKADIGDKLVPVFNKMIAAVEKFANDVAPTVVAMLDNIKKKWEENHVGIEKFGKLIMDVMAVVGPAAIGIIYVSIMTLIDAIGFIGRAWDNAKKMFAAVVTFWLAGFQMLIDAAVVAFGWIPGIGPKLKQAQAEFAKFREQVNAELAAILDKDVHVRVQVSRSGEAAPAAGGGSLNTGHVSGRRIMASGGLGGGLLTMVNDGGPELIDWQQGRVHSFQETRRALASGGGGGGGGGNGGTAIVIGGAGNNAGMLASAQATLMRYLFSSSIKLIDSSGGRVRMV
jgi:phage-related minor tail protein